MRVLHVIPNYVPAYIYGGPVKSTHDLCRALSAKGVDVLVLTTNANGRGNLDVAVNTVLNVEGINVIYCRRGLPTWYYYSRDLLKALKAHIAGFDLVHIHSVYLYPTFAAANLARKYKKPYIINPLGAFDPQLIDFRSSFKKNIYIKMIERHNISGASVIHASSLYEKEAIVSMGVNVPVAVIPRGLNLKEYDKPLGMQGLEVKYPQLKGKRVILFLGRIDPQKGMELLISAFKMVILAGQDAYLVVAGPAKESYLSYLKSLCVKEKIAERVIFPGPLFGIDKISAFYSSDIFVLPSFKESFGISVLEAMAVGLPVVVTKRIGLSPDIEECGCGIVTDYSPQYIRDAILGMLKDDVRRRDMGKKGRRLVEERFTWDNMSSKMISVYDSILNKPKS